MKPQQIESFSANSEKSDTFDKTDKLDKTNHFANADHREGPVAKAIEKQTAKLPSDTFLWAALASIGASAALQVAGKKQVSNFVGQWAPVFLMLGLYNKLVKVAGSDRQSHDIEASEPDEVVIH